MQFEDSDVKILSGVDEGAFAWLTLNYLLGKLGGSEQDTGAAQQQLPACCYYSCCLCAWHNQPPWLATPWSAVLLLSACSPACRAPPLPWLPACCLLFAVASIDLGGGSVQEAYAMSDKEAAAAPDKMYLTELHGGGKTYHVYVHRWVSRGELGRAGV